MGALTASYTLLWLALEERAAHCETPFCGLGEGILMVYAGGPLLVVLVGLALRLAGARSALLGTGALVLGLLLLSHAAEAAEGVLEVPALAWPLLVAALAALWFPLEQRILPQRSVQQVEHDRQQH